MCKIYSKEILSPWRKTVEADFLVFVKSRPNADILLSAESVEQTNPPIDLSVEKYLRFVKNQTQFKSTTIFRNCVNPNIFHAK